MRTVCRCLSTGRRGPMDPSSRVFFFLFLDARDPLITAEFRTSCFECTARGLVMPFAAAQAEKKKKAKHDISRFCLR